MILLEDGSTIYYMRSSRTSGGDPDTFSYDNRAEIAQGAKDVGNQVIDQGRALNERLRG